MYLDDGIWLFYDIHFKIITIMVTGNVIAEQSDFWEPYTISGMLILMIRTNIT